MQLLLRNNPDLKLELEVAKLKDEKYLKKRKDGNKRIQMLKMKIKFDWLY